MELQDAVYETNIPNGYMIPLSAPVANPSILLENPRFSEMIETCAGKFDYVLIDTPPLESVADGLRIAAHADGTVLVVRSGQTSRKLVADAVDKLKRTGTPVLGIALNRVEMQQKGGYYYKRYYYNGDYGRGYGRTNSQKRLAASAENKTGR